jgi:GMP synthase-like glutamine amidotransferase
MRIRVLQHVPFEGPAAIGDWAQINDHTLDITRLDLGETLPAPSDFDWLIVMGGPMGVGDMARYPWMAPELACIRQALDSDRRVLGICLGAQLLAHALGAQVHQAPEREIGWFDVEALPLDGAEVCDALPPRFTPLHWHGDTYDLPAGAVQLARSAACEQQAFQFGARAIGLQFHIESTPDSVAQLIAHCGDGIGDGPWQQPATRINDCRARCQATRPVLEGVLRYLESAGP